MSESYHTTDTPGYYAAKKQTWRKIGLRDTLYSFLTKHPGQPRQYLKDVFFDYLFPSEESLSRREQNDLRSIFEYWFDNTYNSLTDNRISSRNNRIGRIENNKDIREAVERAKTVIHRKIEDKALVLYMETVMPNGKLLGDCTFGELVEIGGRVVNISKMGDPDDIVRNKLSPRQLARIQVYGA